LRRRDRPVRRDSIRRVVNQAGAERDRPAGGRLPAAEMEQHVQFGSFTSPPVAWRGTRRSPAAWLSVLPCPPGLPGNNWPDCRVVPTGDRLCRRQANCDPDCQACSRAALDRGEADPAGGPAMGVAIGRQLDRVAMEEGGGIAVYE